MTQQLVKAYLEHYPLALYRVNRRELKKEANADDPNHRDGPSDDSHYLD